MDSGPQEFFPCQQTEEESAPHQAIKLQVNEGQGGCFPCHFDSDEALDGRKVTAIFYLNPSWKPGEGGELRLYPWPSPPLDIAPIADRLVLFSSTRMWHRVLPSGMRDRACFTIWMSQSSRRYGRARLSSAMPPRSGCHCRLDGNQAP